LLYAVWPDYTGGVMTLILMLKKEWFDKIKNGEKTIEYREAKDYWHKRLNKNFDAVILKNGYSRNAPSLIADIEDIRIINGRNTDLKINKDVYAIELKKVRPYCI
jgi:lysine/ornithine N-monooxygenase